MWDDGALLGLGEQALRDALLGRGLGRGEDLGGATDPVGGQVVRERRGGVDKGRVVQVDAVGVDVEAEDLDPARKGLVTQFLLPAPIQLLLVPARGVPDRNPAGVGHVHVREAVRFDGLVVEPGAIARLPLEAADHAELGAAAAGHVVAAFLELDGGGAVEAPLPALFLCDFDKLLCRRVFGTLAARVPLVVAGAADFGLAAPAFAVLPAPVGPTAGVDVDVRGSDPRAATPRGAVDAVFGGVL